MFFLEFMVFGDVNNDKDMFVFVKYSYVMENSYDEELFKIVFVVVLSNDK